MAALSPVSGAVIYDNTSTDTFVTYFYSSNGTSAIGDSIGFGGSERLLTDVAVQFYNGGLNSGTFSAIVQLYDAGASFGTLVGSAVQVDDIAIGSFESLTVSFLFPNLLVPDLVAFTVSVANVSTGLDLGLNAFVGPSGANSPPAVGTSNLSQIVVGSPISLALTAEGQGNLYFLANATSIPSGQIPEPSTLLTFGAGLLILVARRLRS